MSIISSGWLHVTVLDRSTLEITQHVVPLFDQSDHELHIECHCDPILDDDGTVVHNSFDGREHVERLLDPDNMFMN